MGYVLCSKCGKKVSNVLSGDLVVRAFVECIDCVENDEYIEIKCCGECIVNKGNFCNIYNQTICNYEDEFPYWDMTKPDWCNIVEFKVIRG